MMENLEELSARISKLEFHVKLLAESVNAAENPTASLVVDYNWSSEDLDCAHDIFEIFDNKLRNKEVINWYELEREFKNRMNISYQGLKSIILAFYRNGQWTEVCQGYAASFGDTVSIELKSIARSVPRPE